MTIVWIMVMVMILTMPIWKAYQSHHQKTVWEKKQKERIEYTREFLKSQNLYGRELDEYEISEAAREMALLRYDLPLGVCRVLIENELNTL